MSTELCGAVLMDFAGGLSCCLTVRQHNSGKRHHVWYDPTHEIIVEWPAWKRLRCAEQKKRGKS